MLPAQPEIQRQPVDRPGVLHVDPHVAVDVVAVVEGPVGHADFLRHAVPVLLPPDVGVVAAEVVAGAETVHDAHLRVVRPRDVRRRDVVVELLRAVELLAPVVPVPELGLDVPPHGGLIPRVHRVAVLPRVVVIAGRDEAGQDAGGPRLEGAGRLGRVPHRPVLDVGRVAGLEQQAAADGGGPLGGRRVVDRRRQPGGPRIDVGVRVVQVVAVLEHPVDVRGELVDVAGLPRQPQQAAGDRVVVDARHALPAVHAVEPDRSRIEEAGRAAVHVGGPVEAVGDLLVDLPVADAPEVPELVADDGASEGDVQVVHHREAFERGDPALERPGLDRLETVRLELVDAAAEVGLPADRVAPLPRDHVDAHPAAGGLGRHAARLVDHLLAREMVVVVLGRAVAPEVVHALPVDLDGDLRRAHPVDRHVGLLGRRRQADLRPVQLDPDDQLRRRLQVVAGRHRVENLAVEHLGPRRRLHVDDRRRARDGHRLFERADAQLGVDRHRERRGELQLVANDGGEAGQREGQRVGAGKQVDDRVATRAVGERGAGTFDQHRTGGLDGNAGQHAAGVVGHLSGESAAGLGRRRTGRERQYRQREDNRTPTSHDNLPMK